VEKSRSLAALRDDSVEEDVTRGVGWGTDFFQKELTRRDDAEMALAARAGRGLYGECVRRSAMRTVRSGCATKRSSDAYCNGRARNLAGEDTPEEWTV